MEFYLLLFAERVKFSKTLCSATILALFTEIQNFYLGLYTHTTRCNYSYILRTQLKLVAYAHS